MYACMDAWVAAWVHGLYTTLALHIGTQLSPPSGHPSCGHCFSEMGIFPVAGLAPCACVRPPEMPHICPHLHEDPVYMSPATLSKATSHPTHTPVLSNPFHPTVMGFCPPHTYHLLI